MTMMMMRVRVTLVLLILGIFCSASWAQPSLSEVRECFDMATLYQCLAPVMRVFGGMNAEQFWNFVATNHLSETCQPVLAARQCALEMLTECGFFELTDPQVAAVARLITVETQVVEYVCTDHVDVFDEHKLCLASTDENGVPDIPYAVIQQCPLPQAAYIAEICIPPALVPCTADIVEEQCGEEIGDAVRGIGELVSEIECEALKHFQKMKKEVYTPLKLINEALLSLF